MSEREDSATGSEQTLRQRAEERMAQIPETLERLSPDQARQALHELRVHQIELEMQNDELRRTQEALEISRARYFELYDLAPVGYVTISDQGLILEANLTTANLLGVARGALAKRPLARYILPEDQDSYYRRRRLLFGTGAPQVCELRMTRQGAPDFWARLEAVLAQDAAGAPVCRMAISDVSAIKQAEQALQRSETMYRTLVEGVDDSIHVKDRQARYVLVNSSMARNVGLNPAEVVGKTALDIYPEALGRKIIGDDMRVLEQGVTVDTEEEHLTPRGRETALVRKVPLRDAAGQVTGMVTVSRNITARKQTEDALRESKALLDAVVESIPLMLFLKEATDLRFVLFNRAGEELLGYDRKAWLGKNNLDLFPPEQAAHFMAKDREVLDGEAGMLDIPEEAILTAKQGQRLLHTRKVRILGADGVTRYLLGISEDITERKQAEQALRDSEERYRLLFQHLTAGFALHEIILDDAGQPSDYRFLEVNPAFERITGLRAADVLGRTVREVLPNTEPYWIETYGRVALTGEAVRLENYSQELDRYHEVSAYAPAPGRFAIVIEDVTERRQLEQEREATVELLRLVNSSNDSHDLIKTLIVFMANWSGCEAVGVRLSDGEDYPYFEVRGFSDEFVQRERYLCARDSDGQIIRDDAGNPVLECMCGNILCGRFDPTKPFFTEHGSFWTNSTTALLASTTEDDRQARTRNRCNGEGYESVALIPLRGDAGVLGLIQLNDHRQDRFTPARIAMLERMADSVAQALAEKLAKKALRDSEERYRTLVDNANEAIIVAQDGLLRFVNPKSSEITGYAAQELLARPFPTFIHPDDRALVVERYQQRIQGIADPGRYAFRVARKDGGARWVELDAVRIEWQGRPATLNFLGDITERKLAEEALRQSERLLNATQRLTGVGGWAWDVAQQDLYWTQEVYRIHEIEPSETPMGPERIALSLACYAPEDRVLVAAAFERCAAQGQPYDLEARFTTVKGREIWARTRGEAIVEHGAVVRVIGNIMDITELKRAEVERLELERRLLHSQKLESLGVLAGGIAHDFNNLLAAILGNLELAQMDLSPLSAARPSLEEAATAAKRAADLTRQMLAYSGKGRFVIGQINLSELMEENAHMLRAAIPRSVTLSLRLAAALPSVEADAGQLQQVVMNLITNAAEAIGDGPGVVTLATGEQPCDAAYLRRSRLEDAPPPGRYVWLEVSDTGCGMSAETQQRMFDPFFTTKAMGRGLGMPATLGVVRGHKGAILIDTEVGRGTTLRVLFPVSEAAPSEAPAPAAPVVELQFDGLSDAKRAGAVLVVDDETMVRAFCQRVIERLGLQTFAAADGIEATRLYAEHADEIACVVLDLTMPDMDGVATFEALQRINPQVKVVLCSGYGEQAATQRLEGQGLAGFIQKPYQVQALRAELRRVLEL